MKKILLFSLAAMIMQSDMKKAYVFVLGMMLLTVGFTGCKYFKPVDGPGMEHDSADYDSLDENMNSVSRISLNADGTATWCMVGNEQGAVYSIHVRLPRLSDVLRTGLREKSCLAVILEG